MQTTSFGDLATSFRNQLSGTRAKLNLQRLSQELSSGRVTDLGVATAGDLGNYAGIETALKSLAAYKVSASEAALFAEAAQRSLEVIQETTSEVGPPLLMAGSSTGATFVQTTANDTRARFTTVVSALNTQVADRALMSGTATGGAATVDAETMLAALQTAIAAETTAAGVAAVVETWFDDPGGGFETSGYLGDTTDLAAFRIGPDETASLNLRADDQSIRDVLKGYAMAALVSDGALSGNDNERAALLSLAGTQMMTGDKGLVELRARVGTVEERIDIAKARNSAETSALELARSEIVEVDPYRTATELQLAETQLQTLYTITARLSRLNLSEFL